MSFNNVAVESIDTAQALDLIAIERQRQDNKWGVQDHDDDRWYAILAEEFGEIARGLNDNDPENVEEEIIQTAAVCVAWLEARWRRKN